MKVDVLIIGGGINGCGIAADAAGRGLKVLLAEKSDLAAATSSASSKLIHGGLRYLEYYEFSLVRKALKEREILLKIAPHLIHPLEFIVPEDAHDDQARPHWLIRLGLFIYDVLGGRSSMPRSRSLRLSQHPAGALLKPEFIKGFRYFDAQTDDARLVVSNALMAESKGAMIWTRSEVISTHRESDHWVVNIRRGDEVQRIQTKALINASGPFINRVLQELQLPSQFKVRLIRGSHIVVPRLYSESFAYLLQHTDKRIIFVTPYCEQFSMIGTTDIEDPRDPSSATITVEEIHYLLQAVNRYWKTTLKPQDIINTWSGVRPLMEDHTGNPSAITRDFMIEVEKSAATLINIFGGKITTYRELAEEVVDKLRPDFPALGPKWTANTPLPGGDLPSSWNEFLLSLQTTYPFIPVATLTRYAKAYGTRVHQLLDNCQSLEDLGRCFGADCYQKELEFLIDREWAYTTPDLLWRRTKLGLVLNAAEISTIEAYIEQHLNH